ncbi:MAG: hypothetical protein RLZZ591_1106 [Pseudomonadota bacterium]|jgi:hypothetical protein
MNATSLFEFFVFRAERQLLVGFWRRTWPDRGPLQPIRDIRRQVANALKRCIVDVSRLKFAFALPKGHLVPTYGARLATIACHRSLMF